MKRSQLVCTTEAKTSVPVLRKRKCKSCGESFRPFTSFAKWCSPECGAKLALQKIEQQKLNKAKEEWAISKAKREELRTIPQLKKEAQAAFNRFVRLRDAGRNCISCNAPPPDLSGLHAGRDAGHYRSTGAADHLRYHEDNCHAQCVKCNQYKAGNVVEYRAGLIWRIGPERVEALEADNTPIKWTREGLREIRDRYRRLARELEKQ